MMSDGASLAIGLSKVHISSQSFDVGHEVVVDAALRSGASIEGCYSDAVVRVPWLPPREVVHPAGCFVSAPFHDDWISVRRWRDGISIGEGPVFDSRGVKKRGGVEKFSDGARRRMLRYLREAKADYRYFGTLTVGADWAGAADFRKAVDRWLVFALRTMQRAARDSFRDPSECSIFWFVEFQKRGAPHLHIFYTHFVNWQPLAFGWAKICQRFGFADDDPAKTVPFSMTSTRFEKFKTGFKGVLSYARKYAVKNEQKEAPEGYWKGRFWGVRGFRRRGSCHVVATRRTDAYRPFGKLKKRLDDMVDAGLMRKWKWERGDGAVYSLIRGEWMDYPGERLEVEREIAWMISLLNSGGRAVGVVCQ